MGNYTLPTGTNATLTSLLTNSHINSGDLLGNLILTSFFCIILFRNLPIDGFKKRATYAVISTLMVGLFLFTIGVVSGFVFGIYVVIAIFTVLWVGFTA